MKLKYYLRGIGIGIIVTTVVLMIAFAVHKEQPLSDDEIRARAMELGMVMAEDLSSSDKLSDHDEEISHADGEQDTSVDAADEEMPAPEKNTASKTKDEEAAPLKNAASEAEDEKTPASQKDTASATKNDRSEVTEATSEKAKDDSSKANASDKADKDQPQTEVTEQVEITIVGGEYSDAVCRKLKKAGVIDDDEAFNKYLSRKGYDNLIQPGTYVVPLGASYATVAKLIIDKNNRKEN